MIINDLIFNAELNTMLLDLQMVLRQNGSQLLGTIKDTQDNVMISCPYHKGGLEKKPSMGVSKETGICHCFACSTTVPLQQMISHCLGDDGEIGASGWKWLVRNYNTVRMEERKDVELDFERTSATLGNGKIRIGGSVNHGGNPGAGRNVKEFVSEEELDKYRYYHPYWAKRGITDEEIIELFDLGYDKDTNCVTMPVRDVHGNCLFVARRSVQTKYFNYPPGVTKPLYGLYELSQIREPIQEVVVCESMIDAITAWQYGRPCVALNGLGTALQFSQLRKLPCRKLILATDMDEAGIQARDRIRKNVTNKIITEYVWDVHVAKDLNDMSKEMFLGLKEIF